MTWTSYYAALENPEYIKERDDFLRRAFKNYTREVPKTEEILLKKISELRKDIEFLDEYRIRRNRDFQFFISQDYEKWKLSKETEND